ncbi:MAG TPA: CYTH domain-containing protein [Rickettsiales bacterium]|nr:CYTH domain-containing protein [Rickettsiales bacterium]
MAKEIEAKFLNVEIEDVRNRLKKLGANLKTPMRLMKRVMAKTPEMKIQKAFVRVRDEGDKITMTYKRNNKETVDGTYEVEIKIDDFANGIELLSAIGIPYETYQESRRETWMLDNVEIVIDEWPWIKPYIEIEGKNEASVKMIAEKLGFDWKQAKFGSVMSAYIAEYPVMERDNILLSDLSEVKFGTMIPKLLIDGITK